MRLKIEGLSKSYKKKKALDSVNLFISNGIYGLLGPNGAGKTTLMRILAGLIAPDEGRIEFDGEDVLKNMDKFRYKIGYLPQEFGCYKSITVEECLDTIGVLKGIRAPERKKQIEQVLAEVNLSNEAKKKVGALSGGMRRRLGIAQAMLGNPAFIMVDEPTAGLDPEERIRFRGFIRRVAANRVVLLSTHIIEDIKNNCDGLALINNGKVKQFDGFEELENMAKGKVWKMVINSNDFYKIEGKYKILSTNTNADNNLEIRVYSEEKPSEDAEAVQPTVEEGYLTWINA
ncbi:MAG TPA: ABC transporter ATP-binding protein [Hungateiclostridium thermocellum]|jgi:ABC-2 type transport system ATP-binding protein|uniref:ABC transporter related protein n=2 Tax=Acetivibrio thermocellus TaxID=1515 RepID=A3DDM5_ACET2|nr:ABC transporter ATP-binding protein [Acetivibrio thermocellus]CDG35513.1 ABC transporter-like protein [Acetivibrio thermocellus BC1]ABN52054.1 ABC transporter related protein [Acetivibrio thermocellus ATCC 27405]ADU74464.1 ABC transporter related protein [Acetivibrio thermocellus DSM 1313]ALX08407.1 Phosphonate-transporting ATPase [Acetivibrio thermocellus AD2]ANV76156.1 Phosphonate-transporting ATPase [Acetivibrio thermocellus DSM 2360]